MIFTTDLSKALADPDTVDLAKKQLIQDQKDWVQNIEPEDFDSEVRGIIREWVQEFRREVEQGIYQ